MPKRTQYKMNYREYTLILDGLGKLYQYKRQCKDYTPEMGREIDMLTTKIARLADAVQK